VTHKRGETMDWLSEVESKLVGVEPQSMCNMNFDLKLDISLWAKRRKICYVCSLSADEDCDLWIGVANLRPLTDVMINIGVYDLGRPLDHEQWKQKLKAVIRNFLVALGMDPKQFEVVHRISDELPQFGPENINAIDEGQLIFKSPADLVRVGFDFTLGNNFDAFEFVAFDNLVKFALLTDSIKAIVRLNGVDPYGAEHDYVWVIIYSQNARARLLPVDNAAQNNAQEASEA